MRPKSFSVNDERQAMKKLVLFDLDGTLLNTIEDLSEAVNYALGLRGFPLHSVDEYRNMVGHGIRNLIHQALPQEMNADEAYVEACVADFKVFYSAHIDVHTRPYPGMVELLNELSALGIKLAVASNKFQAGSEHLMKEFFPDIHFVAVLGNREGIPLKPSPEIVDEVLEKANVSREDAVMVGDSLTDMQTAVNGSIDAIAVSWGYRTKDDLAGHLIVDNVDQLRSAIALSTPRLIFRPWLDSDAEALFKYASDPDVGPRAGWPPHQSVEDSLQIIRAIFSNDHIWALELKETGEPIGCMGYYTHGESNIDIGLNDAELGYWIAKPYWNQGLCTEALQAMIDYCFKVKQFQTLWADFFVNNPASGRVMEKCGFCDTGKINWCSHLFHGDDSPVKIMELDRVL